MHICPAEEIELRDRGVEALLRVAWILEGYALSTSKGIEAASTVVAKPILVEREEMHGHAVFADDHSRLLGVVRATVVQQTQRNVEGRRGHWHEKSQNSRGVEVGSDLSKTADLPGVHVHCVKLEDANALVSRRGGAPLLAVRSCFHDAATVAR